MHRYTSRKAYRGTGSKDIFSVSPLIAKVCLRNVQTCFRFVCMFLRRMIKNKWQYDRRIVFANECLNKSREVMKFHVLHGS